jgi:anti-sigma B factor antagonist
METPPDFAVAVRFSDGEAVVDVSGEIDIATAPALSAAIDCVPFVDLAHVIVDLGNVTFIDSTGLSTLLGMRSRLAAHDVTMTVANVQPQTAKLFGLTGVDAVLLDEANRQA